MATYRAERGQVIVAGTLLVAILSLSLTLSIYRMSGVGQNPRAAPVRETVLGITSDLDRALTYALGNASQVYGSLWLVNSTEYSSQQANEKGRGFLSTWKRSVLTAYSNLGVGLEYTNESFTFSWGEGFGLSNARCMVELNVSAYGFTGWIGDRSRALGLILDADSIAASPEDHRTRLSFTITRDGGRPVSNLGPGNLETLAHIAGDVWVPGNTTSLEYDGEGTYDLVFWPDVNQVSRGVVLTVTTPEDQLVVAAFHRSEEKVEVTFDSLDENRTAPADHLGTVVLADTTLNPLPNSTYVFPGQYLLQYVPEPECVFLNWTVGNESLATVEDSFAELTNVHVTGSTTITAFYGMGGGGPSGPSQPPGTLLVTSIEENRASWGRGTVSLMRRDQGKWKDVEDSPGQRILHNLTKRDDYGILFEPQAGYRFLKWEYKGDVSHGNGNPPDGPNADLIDVELTGGNVTAIYERVLSGMNATVSLSSRDQFDPLSMDRGWIAFDETNYALPAQVTDVPVDTYTLQFIPQNPNQVFLWWERAGDVIVANGLLDTTTAVVQGDGSITAVYLELSGRPDVPEPSNPWDILYVDEGYWLMPSDLWTGDDGKLSPSFSTGNEKQVTLLASPPTPELRIAEHLSVMAFVRVNPPYSVKDVTLELGFEWNDTYYLLGNQTYQLNKEGVYVMPLDSTQAQYPGESRIIPANSTILLWVTITFYPNGWGTFFLYHGITWPSYVYLGGVPTDQEG